MPVLLWDASALTKRYAAEAGSDTVDGLFTAVPSVENVATVLGYAETYSAVVRKHNRGSIDSATFAVAKTSLRNEVVYAPDFLLLTVDDSAVFDGLQFVETYNLNATDAAILAVFLRYTQSLPQGNPPCVIASDQRLVQAAQAEGLSTLNPETLSATQVAGFLSSL